MTLVTEIAREAGWTADWQTNERSWARGADAPAGPGTAKLAASPPAASAETVMRATRATL
jgi:hypothetical protein